jgi:mannose-6-phosphate isomerase-like protein (cupin superfamily)
MITADALKQRFIPFASLRYSTEAFIDYCIPECQPKHNYALIGPGVSQNPNQPVSLREHHGFQVGGVRVPHGKVNTPHMHFTCEVFMCTRGDWRVQWGFNPDVSSADIGEGDLVSVPTWLYRGFTNIGVDDGFLFTALGGDDTGGILWSAATLAAAAQHGVLLTSNYRIVDTRRGDSLAAGEELMQPMSSSDVAQLRVWSNAEMGERVVRFADLRWSTHGLLDSHLPGCGAQLAAAIGLGMAQDRTLQAPVANAHGVSIEWLRIPAQGSVSLHRLSSKQVLIAKAGVVNVDVLTLDGPTRHTLHGHATGWDSFSLPADCWRTLRNSGSTDALLIVLTSGDQRKAIEWDSAVVQAAAKAGLALDANGFVGEKRFIDRAQR